MLRLSRSTLSRKGQIPSARAAALREPNQPSLADFVGLRMVPSMRSLVLGELEEFLVRDDGDPEGFAQY